MTNHIASLLRAIEFLEMHSKECPENASDFSRGISTGFKLAAEHMRVICEINNLIPKQKEVEDDPKL